MMRKLALLLIPALILALTLGCGGGTTEKKVSRVATLNLGSMLPGSWDADPEIDGLEIQVKPTDDNNWVVKEPGTIDIKLYSQTGLGAEKGQVVQEWKGISFTKEEMDVYGVSEQLEYHDGFAPTKDQYGTLDVTFTALDGKIFSVTKRDVRLMR